MRARGFTLVEVLVGALLIVLLVSAALTLVARGRAAYRSQESHSRLEEAAAAALDLLAYEIRMAGFLGPLPAGSPVDGSAAVGTVPPEGLEVSGGCIASLALDLRAPLAGADAAYEARTGIPLGCPASPGGRIVPGADTLVLRRTAAEAGPVDAGRLQLEATGSAGRLMADGALAWGDAARVHDVEVSAFYVSADSTGERGRPSLRRKRLVGGTAPAFQDEELVPGVADLQVEVGVDVDGDGTEDTRVPLDEVEPAHVVRSAHVWILVQGDLSDGAVASMPALSYANRTLAAGSSRFPRLLASRSVELRNGGAAP